MENKNILNEDILATFFKGLAGNYNTLWPLKSLYLCEHKRKFIVGDQVIIESGKMVNRPEDITTHEITLLEGNMADTFHQITVKSLSNNDTSIIQL